MTATQIEAFVTCANSTHCLNQLQRIEDTAVVASRQHARVTTSARDIFCFSQSNNIRNSPVALLVRDSRLQIQKWDKLIQQTIEGGLIEKWSNERNNNLKMESNAEPRPLGVQHFYGSFFLVSLFLFGAINVFILELIIHRKLKGENVHRLWRTANWIIDGRRHMLLHFNQPKKRKQQWQVPIRTYRSRIVHLRQPLIRSRRC